MSGSGHVTQDLGRFQSWQGLGTTSFVAPESKMPDLPGALDEPYDRRFAKWMIKDKVGWALARPVDGGAQVMSLVQPRDTS